MRVGSSSGSTQRGDIGANLVVTAHNTTSFIARETCLRSRHDLEHFVVCMKETSEPTSKIEGRLSLHQDEVPLGLLQEYNEGSPRLPSPRATRLSNSLPRGL